jgi:hypothetical protein
MKTVLAATLKIVIRNDHDPACDKIKPNYHPLAAASPGAVVLAGSR